MNRKGGFVLSREEDCIVKEWNLREKDSWTLSAHPFLPVADVFTEDNKHIGWILGYSVVLDKREFLPERIIFNIKSDRLDTESVESELYKLGGRFVGVFLTDKFSRLYLDPSGSLPSFYSLKSRAVASYYDLLDKGERRCEKGLVEALDRMKSDGSQVWYPSGITPFEDIKVLLPNHFLDLADWKVKRHWPKEEIKEVSTSRNLYNAVKEITNAITDIIDIIAKHRLLHISLTAGKDTRTLLACSRNIIDRIVFYTTTRGPDDPNTIIPRLLARLFNLRHIEDSPLDEERVTLLGFGGEAARGYFWKEGFFLGDGDYSKRKFGAKEALERMIHPDTNKEFFLKSMEDWLSEVSGFNPYFVADLLYIEQHLGCLIGPVMHEVYDRKSTKINLYPMNQRRILDLMLSLPADYKKGHKLPGDIYRIAWPELLDIPLNAPHFAGILKYRKLLKQFYKPIKGKPEGEEVEKRELVMKLATRGRPLVKMLLEDAVKVARRVAQPVAKKIA